MSYGALGTGNTGITEVDAFVPELWSDYVYGYLERKLVFRPLVDDYSEFVQGKGDTIHVPTLSEVSVETKAENTAIQYDATTESVTDITIDQHKYASKIFEDFATVQANEGLVSKYSEAFAYSLAKEIDSFIAGKLITVSSGATLGADDVISQAELQTALASLGEADLDYRNGSLVFAVNPTVYADLLNEDRLVRWDARGDSAIGSGMIDKAYGMPVVMTNALGTGGTNVSGVIFDKSAVGFAMQQGVRMQSEYSVDHLGTKIVADAIYGGALIHATRGYKFTNAT